MGQDHPDFSELLRRARAGDRDAMGQLFEIYRARLHQSAIRELSGPLQVRLDASDVVQQTLLSAIRNLHDFQGEDERAFAVWLDQIQQRNVHDAVRRHVDADKRSIKKEARLDTGQACAAEQGAGRGTLPGDQAMLNEEMARLQKELDSLTADQREAVRLRYFERMALAEIAERLGRSNLAVAALIKRGLENLRKRFQAERPGGNSDGPTP